MCKAGGYDPRIRPWYTAGASPPKDVVVLIDASPSVTSGVLSTERAAASDFVSRLKMVSSWARCFAGENRLV